MRAGAVRGWLAPLLAAALGGLLTAAPAPAAERVLFGFGDSSAIYGYEGAPDASRLAGLERAAGAELGRFTVRWEQLQPSAPPPAGPPRLDWGRYDAFVAALRERGIRPLPVLLGAPWWAREPGDRCHGVCPPSRSHLHDWRYLVAATAARYPHAAAIELWNEPNRVASWATADGPDPRRYAELFDAGAAEVRRLADPGTRIVSGGLSLIGARGQADGNMPIPAFLGGFYRALGAGPGPRAVLGIHAYPGLDELERLRPDGRWARSLAEVREVRDRLDPDPGRRLWVTELGASTTAPAPGGGSTDAALQARAIRNGLAALEAAPDVGAAIVYTMVDRPPAPASPSEQGFGLVGRGPTFTPKPAYCAVAAARSQPVPAGCARG